MPVNIEIVCTLGVLDLYDFIYIDDTLLFKSYRFLPFNLGV